MAKTKFKKQYIDDVLRYFFQFVDLRADPKEGDALESKGLYLMEPDIDDVYKMIPPKPATGYPSLTKFALLKGVTIQTLCNWRKKNKEFDEACDFCDAIQDDILNERALFGTVDGKVAMKIRELKAAAKKEADDELGSRIEIKIKNLTKPAIELKEQEGITSEDTGYTQER